MALDKYQKKRLIELQELFSKPMEVSVILKVENGRNRFTAKLADQNHQENWDKYQELKYLEAMK